MMNWDEMATIPGFPDSSSGGTRQVQREIKHYNLGMMIFAVGYRVRCDELMVDVKRLKL